jgi:isoquinoline 1-oxidoreductase subunit alpha
VETYRLTINGEKRQVTTDPSTPLLWVLRDDLKMTGTKYGCGVAACGACTVHVGGVATRSCVLPIALLGDRPVLTIEGMSSDPVGRVVQNAWVSEDVVQCGYCQSGQIMAAAALLAKTAHPTDEEINSFMSANICRCGTYDRIRRAIQRVANGGGAR